MIDMYHPDIAIAVARLRHDEMTANVQRHHNLPPRPRRRFFRRRRDAAVVVDLVALPPPREGHEVDERRVA